MKTVIGVDDFEIIAKRSLERARKLDKGEAIPAERRITFDNAEDLAAFLTSRRRGVLQAAMQQPRSVDQLAEVLQRARPAVSRDVRALSELGLVRVTKGRKRSKAGDAVVSAVAKKIDLRAQLCA